MEVVEQLFKGLVFFGFIGLIIAGYVYAFRYLRAGKKGTEAKWYMSVGEKFEKMGDPTGSTS